MRIAFLAWQGSVHTRRWVEHFAALGHEVHVVTCGDGDADAAASYRVHDLGRPRAGKLGYLFKLRRARAVVRRLEPDVVHAHYATSYGLLALAAGTGPLVVTAHGDDILVSPANPLMRRLVQRVLRRADLVTVPAPHMETAVRELCSPAQARVEVFQYGVEVDRLASAGDAARAAAPSRDGLVIVSARPLLDLYRVDLLVQAVALLAGRGVDARLEVLGDGPSRAQLQQLAHSLGVDERVSFLGQVEPAVVERHIASCDLYASVAASDGASLALLEAMALGAIPVLSDIPANRAWIRDGEGGAISAPDAESVARAIERAAALDRARAVQANRTLVRLRADRATNLGRCEGLLSELAGRPQQRAA